MLTNSNREAELETAVYRAHRVFCGFRGLARIMEGAEGRDVFRWTPEDRLDLGCLISELAERGADLTDEALDPKPLRHVAS